MMLGVLALTYYTGELIEKNLLIKMMKNEEIGVSGLNRVIKKLEENGFLVSVKSRPIAYQVAEKFLLE